MPATPLLSVYLVLPDPVERERVVRELAGHVRQIVAFECGRDLLANLSVEPPACVVAALVLPDIPPIEFIAAARAAAPVIILGRVDDVSVAVELIRAGAADVLDRPLDARRLRNAVRATLPRTLAAGDVATRAPTRHPIE